MSTWIDHVKNVAKSKGIAYGKAMKVASKTWKKKCNFRQNEKTNRRTCYPGDGKYDPRCVTSVKGNCVTRKLNSQLKKYNAAMKAAKKAGKSRFTHEGKTYVRQSNGRYLKK